MTISHDAISALTKGQLLVALNHVDQHFWPPRPTRQDKATLVNAIWQATRVARHRDTLVEYIASCQSKPKLRTRRDRLIAGLEKLGYTRDHNTTSTRFAVFLPPLQGGLDLGNHRALVSKLSIRYTRGAIAESIPMSERLINFILEQVA